ncbi:MAG: hypothetical protein LBQ46_00015 [Treponema sp.]|jgi:hypothetical protein|nr:hypothetical protein [Treponema sp.]
MKKLLACFFLLLGAPAFSQEQVKDTTLRVNYSNKSNLSQTYDSQIVDLFSQEISALSYVVVDSGADYDFNITITDVMDILDDGTSMPAYQLTRAERDAYGLRLYELQVTLTDNKSGGQMLLISSMFDVFEDLYEIELPLTSQILANIPRTKNTGIFLSDMWRNKRVYLSFAADLPLAFYTIVKPAVLWTGSADAGFRGRDADTDNTQIVPGLIAGLEVQFLDWMSAEANFAMMFGDSFGNTFTPSVQIKAPKFIWKPAIHFMIEAYPMVEFEMSTSPILVKPRMAAGGGVQFGIRGFGGNTGDAVGAFFLDLNFRYSIGETVYAPEGRPVGKPGYDPASSSFNHYVLGISVGYKIGFMDRKPKAPDTTREPPPPPNDGEAPESG